MKRYIRDPNETREEENARFKAEDLRLKIYLVCYLLGLLIGLAIGLYQIKP